MIFYDRDCGFCRRMLRLVLLLDRRRGYRLTPVPLQSPRVARDLSGLSEAERMASWHLRTSGGAIVSGGAAIAPLLEVLEFPDAASEFFASHPTLADRGYRWVANHRTLLGRLTRWLPDLEDAASARD